MWRFVFRRLHDSSGRPVGQMQKRVARAT
eukprot:COSAG06_NODE_61722_length_267_cov_0.565476_1_plen_28_part_01